MKVRILNFNHTTCCIIEVKKCDVMLSYQQLGSRITASQVIMADGSSKWLSTRLSQIKNSSNVRIQSKSIYSLCLKLSLSNSNVIKVLSNRFVNRCVSCGNRRSVQMISALLVMSPFRIQIGNYCSMKLEVA